jgi:hypothetical protein
VTKLLCYHVLSTLCSNPLFWPWARTWPQQSSLEQPSWLGFNLPAATSLWV